MTTTKEVVRVVDMTTGTKTKGDSDMVGTAAA
jgi:hypothetical protein